MDSVSTSNNIVVDMTVSLGTSVFLVIAIVIWLVVRILHLTSPARAPVIACKETEFNQNVIKEVPLLRQAYQPPSLWGKSGHLQTLVYGKMGRTKLPLLRGDRHMVSMPDGATMTFDVYERLVPHSTGADLTMLVCPGIGNSSEATYVRTFVLYAQKHGYRVAVLNHLGAVLSVPLTSPRIFTYGGTDEYHAMVMEVNRLHSGTSCIAVGFSMGGNIILKYLGERAENEYSFIGAVSCCQGYDAGEVMPYLLSWTHLRRLYIHVMTHHMKALLYYHRSWLFGPEATQRYGPFNYKALMQASTLNQLDELYTRRREGFESLLDYYRSASCRYYMSNITIPVMVLNALDDPLVPEELLYIPKEFAMSHDNAIYVQTDHGGHLGFFEGETFFPRSLTWMDKVVVEYCDALFQAVGLLSTRIDSKPVAEDVFDATQGSFNSIFIERKTLIRESRAKDNRENKCRISVLHRLLMEEEGKKQSGGTAGSSVSKDEEPSSSVSNPAPEVINTEYDSDSATPKANSSDTEIVVKTQSSSLPTRVPSRIPIMGTDLFISNVIPGTSKKAINRSHRWQVERNISITLRPLDVLAHNLQSASELTVVKKDAATQSETFEDWFPSTIVEKSTEDVATQCSPTLHAQQGPAQWPRAIVQARLEQVMKE